MDDIAPGLLEKLRKTLSENLESDKKAGNLRKKIEQGTANYETAGDYADRAGKALAEAFDSCLSDDVLPDGKMHWNIAERVLQPVFKDDYEILSDAAVKVQQSLNSKAKIGLKAQKAEMDESMVSGVMNKIASTEKYSESAYVLKEASDTFSRSVVDNTLKANIEFQGKAGRKPRIIRTPASGCCEWCAGLAGTYSYPDTPKDVYARHNNCNCIVEYDPGSGSSRQNVHTKQWTTTEENAKIEARKIIGLKTNGTTTITGVSDHVIDQMKARNVTMESIMDAIKNPLKTGETKHDDIGRPSFTVVGKKATIAVNPDTGNVITTYPTHTKTANKLMQKKKGKS